MSYNHPEPVELTLVRTERAVRLCLAYNEQSVAAYKDNTLIRMGIDQAIPLLRDYYGRKYYVVERQSVERTGRLAKVVLDLSLG